MSKDIMLIFGMAIILCITFVAGMFITYQSGFYNGMNEICDNGIGINEDYEYVCYDEQEKLPQLDNVNFEGDNFDIKI